MRERRTDIRVDVCLDAIWDGTRGNSHARVTDLSENGCYVDSICDVHVGEILHFKVQLPSGDWLDLTGRVAHHFARIGFGLQFVDLNARQVEQLRWLLDHLRHSNEHPQSRICA